MFTNKNLIKLILIGFLSLPLSTFAEVTAIQNNQINTIQGTLSIIRSTPDNPPDSISLNGKTIYKEEGYYVNIEHLIKLANAEVVLYSTNCGGSGCGISDYGFLVLLPNTEPKLINHKDFSAYPNDVKVTQEGNIIKVDLGFDQGKRKTAILDKDNLSIQLTASSNTIPVPTEHCEWLYTQALDACIYTKQLDANADCNNAQGTITGGVMRGIIAMSNYPGFVDKAFDQACVASCNNSQKSTYAEFAATVCSSTPKPKPHTTTATIITSTTTPNNTSTVTNTTTTTITNSAISACGVVENYACLNEVLKPEKKRLNQTYQALSTLNSLEKNVQLDNEQRTWLEQRNAKCGKMTAEIAAAELPHMTQCILTALTERTDQLEQTLKQLQANGHSTTTNKPTNNTEGKWYQSTAKPSLTVRDKPDVTGKKLGTVPEGGKVRVLDNQVKADSISGHNGYWVKIEWLAGNGYVFDVFLKPLQ